MLFSMTGYGKAENTLGGKKCVVEMRSVNNRYIDISLRMPKRLNQLGEIVRRTIRKNFSRGSFDVNISFNGGEGDNNQCQYLKPNLKLAARYMESIETLKRELKIEDRVTLDTILSLNDIFLVEKVEEDVDALRKVLGPTLEKAMEELKSMRSAEGDAMAKDITSRLETIREKTIKIKEEQPRILKGYKDRLAGRIKQLADEVNADPGRIAQEAAIFAERADVSEEISRTECHLDQIKKHLTAGGTVGRKLDFILQELNRETNTLMSKVPDYSCTDDAIEIKGELEKIREQVQNIE